MPKLTDLTIPRLPPGEHWDTLLPAFGVRVGKRRRTFIINQHKTRKTIGHYPAKSLSQARNDARAYLADPRAPQANFEPLGAILERYLASLTLRPKTLYEYQRLLRKYLPDKPDTRQLITILDGITSKPERRHTHAAMSAFFKWCVHKQYMQSSPLAPRSVRLLLRHTARACRRPAIHQHEGCLNVRQKA